MHDHGREVILFGEFERRVRALALEHHGVGTFLQEGLGEQITAFGVIVDDEEAETGIHGPFSSWETNGTDGPKDQSLCRPVSLFDMGFYPTPHQANSIFIPAASSLCVRRQKPGLNAGEFAHRPRIAFHMGRRPWRPRRNHGQDGRGGLVTGPQPGGCHARASPNISHRRG
jgi:hypothetical protein